MKNVYFKHDSQYRQFTDCTNVISYLKDLYKNNSKIKIWSPHFSGLGDCFSHLNATLFICSTCCEIPLDNITFSPSKYTNLNKYILSDQIKISDYEECLKSPFDVCITGDIWSAFQMHLSHKNHFSKFFTYSKSILDQTSKYSDFTCVYLRFYNVETERIGVEKLMKEYMKAFLNQWSSSEQYIICSPHPIIENQSWPSNVMLSTQLNNVEINSPQYAEDQRNNTEMVVRDMAILSNSKKVIVFIDDASAFFSVGMYLSTHNKPILQEISIEENIQTFKTGKYHPGPMWKNVEFKKINTREKWD